VANLRKALVFSSIARYAAFIIAFLATMITGRLLSPADFGISILGVSILGIAEAIREAASVTYLVQEHELTTDKIRTVFTISLLMTIVLTIVMLALSRFLTQFYGLPGLAQYIRVIALSYAVAPFAQPIYALFARNLQFGTTGVLDVITTLLKAGLSVGLVLAGFGLMALAWAAVISSVAWTLMGFYLKRDFSVYRPTLVEWRSVLAFGFYGSATSIVNRLTNSVFYLIIGWVLDPRTVGLCERAILLAEFPNRVILAGVSAVALPAFSDHVRQGGDLRNAHLNSLRDVTAILWPALVFLCLFAEPVVFLAFGPQWRDGAHAMRLFSVAFMFYFPVSLTNPILIAAGGVRQTVILAITQMALVLGIVSLTAPHGLEAIAYGTILSMTLTGLASLWLVQSLIPFQWTQLARSLGKSALLALCSNIGPCLLLINADSTGARAAVEIVLSGAVLGALGWLAGLWVTAHPLFAQLRHAGEAVAGRLAKGRAARRLQLRLTE
jgi:O-antigen/teichoic acid export membrane protein